MWKNPRPPYPNELYHHGIKGQHWGVRNGPPYPLWSDGSKVDKNPYGLSRGDKAYNLDKWGKSPNTNCLYVTGYSGSGKSTLAGNIAKKFNAEHIELDNILSGWNGGTDSKSFTRYFTKSNPEWVNIRKNYAKWYNKIFVTKSVTKQERDKYFNARDKILTRDIPNFAKQMYGKKPVIVEGIQLMFPDDWGGKIGITKSTPVLIKGTGQIRSNLRVSKRDINFIKNEMPDEKWTPIDYLRVYARTQMAFKHNARMRKLQNDFIKRMRQ